MLKGGIIAYSGRQITLPCVVRDISGQGARLQVERGLASVPDTFELIIELDGLEAKCEVVRKDPTGIGVRFLEPPSVVSPRRVQSLWQTGPAAGTSLRRAPVEQAAVVPSPSPDSAGKAGASSGTLNRPGVLQVGHKSLTIPIAIAEDDPDDRFLLEDAFRASNFRHPCTYVENGEELLKLLRGLPPYQNRQKPGLVLLDLNMPRMDGRTALMHIRTDPLLRQIPVIVITTSHAEEDIARTYDLGVSAYIPKPNNQDGLSELVQCLEQYWLRMVMLPLAGEHA